MSIVDVDVARHHNYKNVSERERDSISLACAIASTSLTHMPNERSKASTTLARTGGLERRARVCCLSTKQHMFFFHSLEPDMLAHTAPRSSASMHTQQHTTRQ
jgi:hypothetical protein